MSDIQCELHGSTIRTAEGAWLCCEQEAFSVFEPQPPATETPDEATVAARRAAVAAALHRETT